MTVWKVQGYRVPPSSGHEFCNTKLPLPPGESNSTLSSKQHLQERHLFIYFPQDNVAFMAKLFKRILATRWSPGVIILTHQGLVPPKIYLKHKVWDKVSSSACSEVEMGKPKEWIDYNHLFKEESFWQHKLCLTIFFVALLCTLSLHRIRCLCHTPNPNSSLST